TGFQFLRPDLASADSAESLLDSWPRRRIPQARSDLAYVLSSHRRSRGLFGPALRGHACPAAMALVPGTGQPVAKRVYVDHSEIHAQRRGPLLRCGMAPVRCSRSSRNLSSIPASLSHRERINPDRPTGNLDRTLHYRPNSNLATHSPPAQRRTEQRTSRGTSRSLKSWSPGLPRPGGSVTNL